MKVRKYRQDIRQSEECAEEDIKEFYYEAAVRKAKECLNQTQGDPNIINFQKARVRQ